MEGAAGPPQCGKTARLLLLTSYLGRSRQRRSLELVNSTEPVPGPAYSLQCGGGDTGEAEREQPEARDHR